MGVVVGIWDRKLKGEGDGQKGAGQADLEEIRGDVRDGDLRVGIKIARARDGTSYRDGQ